jgi:tetratricopeptide (TPR) repeat protein
VVAALTAALLLVLVAGTAGSAVAAYYFSRLAGAEAKARADADRASTEIRGKDNELRDQSERLKRASNLVDSGRLHADASQYDKALADYTAAVEQRPDVPALWLGRGQFYMQFLCWDEAAADFARGFELQSPVDPKQWLQHAWLRLYVGDRDGYRRVCATMLDQFGQTTDLGTMGDLAQACTAGPDALDDYTRLIQLLEKPGLDGMHPGLTDSLLSVNRRAGRVEQALRLRVSPLGNNSAWGGGEAALAYHALGQDDKARKRLADFNQDLDDRLNQVWEVELTHIPQSSQEKYDLGAYLICREVVQELKGLGAVEHPLFWILRGRGRAALEQWDAAAADLARAIALRPDDPRPRLERGRLLHARKHWEEAAADYDEVLRQHPEDGNLWLERGIVYAAEGRWDQAAADFNRALEQPNFSNHSAMDVTLPLEMLQPDAAFDALVRLRPRDAHLWEERGRALDLAGNEAAAAAAYARAVDAAPDDLMLRYYRGLFLGQSQRWDEAAGDFARVLARLPESPELGHLGPLVHAQLLKWDQALDRTLALRPADGQLYAIRARWRLGRNQRDEALAAFGEALKLLPDDPGLHRERGTLYAQCRRWKEAAADFDVVVEQRPFGEDWLVDACLRRLSGDMDGYRRLCAQIAERYARTSDGTEAYVAGRIVAMTPDSGIDPALAVRWQERAVARAEAAANARQVVADPGDYTNWPLPSCFHALGLAHYRAGRFEAAARWYRDSNKSAAASPELPFISPLNSLGLALVCCQLKQPEEARRNLDAATAWMKDANAQRPAEEAEFAPPGMDLSYWLEYQVLRGEVDAALKQQAPKSQK